MDLNQSVRKAGLILRQVARADGCRAATISREAEIPWATTVRLLRSLEREGLVFRDADSELYFLGLELWRLARAADLCRPVEALTRPVLEELAAQTDETVNLAIVRAGGELDIVSQIDPDYTIRPTSWVGWQVSLHASTFGKLLLASYSDSQIEAALADRLEPLTPATIVNRDDLLVALAQIREDGFALAVDEAEVGLSSLAIGSYDATGKMTSAVSVSGASFRFSGAARRRAKPLVAAAAARVSAVLSTPSTDAAAADVEQGGARVA